MTPQEYAAQQALITAALLRFITQFGVFFRNPLLTVVDWIGFLRLLYPEVAAARERSAVLARDFYDFQRALAHPELPRLARELEPYRFDWFVDAMEPAREVMSKPEASDRDLGQVAALAAREVENAGRRQIIHAVRADKPLDDKIVQVTEGQSPELARHGFADSARAASDHHVSASQFHATPLSPADPPDSMTGTGTLRLRLRTTGRVRLS